MQLKRQQKNIVRPYIQNTVCILFSFFFSTIVFAQKKDCPEVGKPCPGFTLKEIHYFPLKKASLKDFKGKWLVLDFWNKNCTACVQSFPKMDSLRKEFNEKVNFVSVGYTGSSDDKKIRTLYAKLHDRLNLELPEAFDSTLFNRWGIYAAPYIVIVDPGGIVKGITYAVSSDDMRDFLAGRTPVLGKVFNKWQSEEKACFFDYNKPLLVNGNGGDDTAFLFRSLLTKWDPGITQYVTSYFLEWPQKNRVLLTCITLEYMYRVAFGDTIESTPYEKTYGTWWKKPVLELSDSSEFESDFKTAKGLYCYDLIVPIEKANKLSMQAMMQRDLQNYFGYDVKVEKRMMPYWKLTAAPGVEDSLKTKGGKQKLGGDESTKLNFTNMPVSSLVVFLSRFKESPIVDETGITRNLDFALTGFLKDFNEVKTTLQKNGFDLVEGKKEMNVIVIRDPKKN